jgi:orotate phosphoribosyltransferase
VREAGGEIVLVLTMVDREEGATEAFAEVGLSFDRSTRPESS